MHGTASVRGDGAVRVCVEPTAPLDDDELTITITDTQHDGRALPITIPIQIKDGTPAPTCNLDDFDAVGGCNSRGDAEGAIPLTIGVLGLMLRRRR